MMVMNDAMVIHDTEAIERMVSFLKCLWRESYRGVVVLIRDGGNP
jgi:hypothetical protein